MNPTEQVNHTPPIRNLIYAPFNYSYWWILACLSVLLLIIGIYTLIIVWTLPYSTLQRYALTRGIASRIVKKKFIRSLDLLNEDIVQGKIELRTAYHLLDKRMRSYLQLETQLPLPFMTLDQIDNSKLAPHINSIAIPYTGKYAQDSDEAILKNISHFRELIDRWEK